VKNKKQNIEQFLQDKPELGFIIGVLSKQSVIANEVWQRQSPRQSQSVNNFNQEEFIRLIKHHRLDSIFYKAVQEQDISLPTELKEKLEQINKRNKMRMMKLTAELIRIHKLFAENGIEYISLKGPALSQQIYGDYTIRSSRDLDILVMVEDLDKLNLLLQKIDYFTNVKDFKKHQKAHHDIAFVNKEKKIQLEIHTRLFSFDKLFEYSNNELFKTKETVILNNYNICVLNNNINSKFLYTHAKKHSWELFYWITDLFKLDCNKNELINKFLLNQQSNKRKNHLSFLFYTLSLNKSTKHKYNVFTIYFRRFSNWIKKSK